MILFISSASYREIYYMRMAYKPDFVQSFHSSMTIHLGLLLPTSSCNQPESAKVKAPSGQCLRDSYLVLLPAGLAMPVMLPPPRWALTPPFHPNLCQHRQFIFCGAVPRVTPGGHYPPPLLYGVRTFLACTQSSSHPQALIMLNYPLGQHLYMENSVPDFESLLHQIYLISLIYLD